MPDAGKAQGLAYARQQPSAVLQPATVQAKICLMEHASQVAGDSGHEERLSMDAQSHQNMQQLVAGTLSCAAQAHQNHAQTKRPP